MKFEEIDPNDVVHFNYNDEGNRVLHVQKTEQKSGKKYVSGLDVVANPPKFKQFSWDKIKNASLVDRDVTAAQATAIPSGEIHITNGFAVSVEKRRVVKTDQRLAVEISGDTFSLLIDGKPATAERVKEWAKTV